MNSIDTSEIAGKLWQYCQQERIQLADFGQTLQKTYMPLITRLNAHIQTNDKVPFVIGINGPIGSGKTTLSHIICLLLKTAYGVRTVRFSLDDLYLSREERRQMAVNTHPLFATRGVPGTHDVALGLELFAQLAHASEAKPVLIPTFDKTADDLFPPTHWQKICYRPDVIVFEGWCVGSQPQSEQDLMQPVNALELEKDADGRWRHLVNQYLANEYQQLFANLDLLLFLKAPSFDCVKNWRAQQEQHLLEKFRENNDHKHRPHMLMNSEQLTQFVAHFERIIRHNLATLPESADIVVELDEARTPRIAEQ